MSVRKLDSGATCLLVLISFTTLACGQQKSTRMIPVGSSCENGSVSVKYGSLYQDGQIKIQPYDLAKLPALPDGYEVFGGQACLIMTTAVIGPPHIITFNVNSVTDETTFGSLRIFHAEPDTFDPDSNRWFDRTILRPEKSASEFKTKTLSASTDELGVFVIGRLVREVPRSLTDLGVECRGSADRVRQASAVTYSCKVTNHGPQAATDVGLIDSFPPEATFVTYRASQGTCKERAGHLYCKLGSLPVGASATVELVLKPYEGIRSLPAEGKTVANVAWVAAKEDDNDRENDRATQLTLVLPELNGPVAK